MPRVKIPRKSTAIDMTAMCDVAFLLLTFFILTAKPRTEDPIPVDSPAAAIVQQLPESDVATLTVGQKKVFFGVDGQKVREELLDQMGKRYSIEFTPQEKAVFASLPSFGVDIQNLKGYLNLTPDERKEYRAPGIPVDTTTESQLYHWVREARIVNRNLSSKELRIAIKGDNKEEYPTIAVLIKALQKQKINKFALITNVKAVPK